ncbi:MAG: aminotransferase class IV [Pirellulaceae bacterium]
MSDFGIRQGVTAVERLRTYGGSLFAADRHLGRLAATTQELRIDGLPSEKAMIQLIDDLLLRNADFVKQQGDVGVTVIATPGDRVDASSTSTLAMHLNAIDLDTMRRRQQDGQPIVMTDVQQPPAASWSRQIKVRCRIHYYRADIVAKQMNDTATGVLIDNDGSVTESSIANLAIVESGTIVSPESLQVLGGVTQSVVQDIAAELGIDWRHARLTPHRVLAADEILLMGTDGGLWWGWDALAANSKGGKSAGPKSGEMYRKLRRRFNEITSA